MAMISNLSKDQQGVLVVVVCFWFCVSVLSNEVKLGKMCFCRMSEKEEEEKKKKKKKKEEEEKKKEKKKMEEKEKKK
ncbi:hypothetical protein M8J75_001938 [Diaphorina citri]|nr:hypothetical protein M8J75_001938 [Diaphorina citri]